MWMESDAINIDGMVRLYRGDVLNDWSDSSGTGGGALLLYGSGQSFVTESPYAAAGGTDRLVFSFDDTNGCARTTDSAGLPSGAQPRTMMGWINHKSFINMAVPFGYGKMAPAQAFNVYNSPNLDISFDWAHGGDGSFTNFYKLSLNAWFHVAITYDGTHMRAYVNGAKKREVNDMTPNTQL